MGGFSVCSFLLNVSEDDFSLRFFFFKDSYRILLFKSQNQKFFFRFSGESQSNNSSRSPGTKGGLGGQDQNWNFSTKVELCTLYNCHVQKEKRPITKWWISDKKTLNLILKSDIFKTLIGNFCAQNMHHVIHV